MTTLESLRIFEVKKPLRSELEVDVSTWLRLMGALTDSGEKGISWRTWGKLSGTKSLGTLLKEIRKGESIFVRTEKGELVRKASKAIIDVIHVDSYGNKYGLYEEIRTSNGWVRRHEDPISQNGVKEKALPFENPQETALRGLHEEMEVKDLSEDELKDLDFIGSRVELLESNGYPGLNTRYTFSDFKFKLPLRFYRPEYYFREGRRRMRLLWEKIV